MNSYPHLTQPRYVIAGELSRDTILPSSEPPLIDLPGGSLLYTAAGISIWDDGVGLVGRAGSDYPLNWLADFSRRGWDVRGIKILPDAIDLRRFSAYERNLVQNHENPILHFARSGFPFPPFLIGYQKKNPKDDLKSLNLTAVRVSDFPPDYPQATAAHICPMNYLVQSLLQPFLRDGQVTTLTLRASSGYMLPENFDDVLTLVNRLTAFITSEEQIRSLFGRRSSDLWEMAARLARPGCEIVIILRGLEGVMVYHAESRKKWVIPAYSSRVRSLTGAADAFCGGFLAGYRFSYDPLEAALRGLISSSLVMDGFGPFFALESLPGLAEARLEKLRELVWEG